MRRTLVGVAAVVAMLGWLQLAPTFGFPVTAPAGMLERVFGVGREAGPVGWLMLLFGLAGFTGFYFYFVERRVRRPLAPIAFAAGAWVLSGVVVMTVVGILQGPAVVGDPMHVEFFMLSLGPGAAAESLVGWLIFSVVLASDATARMSARTVVLASGAVVLAAAAALAVPRLNAQGDSSRVVEGHLGALPAGPVFISVLELPQPAGAVLGPHMHIAGFVLDVAGTATMVSGDKVVDVGPGEAGFISDLLPHDHENRAAVPLAIALAAILIGATVALAAFDGRRRAVPLMAAVLVAGTVATVNPLMNHWYFIGVRPAAQRGGPMLVAAAHRTYESEDLSGLPSGPFLERLTDRRIATGESVHFVGPAAIVVLDGQVSVTTNGTTTALFAQSGTTIAGGVDAIVQGGSATAQVVVFQVAGDRVGESFGNSTPF